MSQKLPNSWESHLQACAKYPELQKSIQRIMAAEAQFDKQIDHEKAQFAELRTRLWQARRLPPLPNAFRLAMEPRKLPAIAPRSGL